MNKPFVICIIDDDKIYQFAFSRIIKMNVLPNETLIFSDGEEALQFLTDNIEQTERLPDIIFLDINMPVMDGWQFLDEYVAIKPRIGKIITIYMVSSSVDPVDLERAQKINEISEYFVKPILPNKLQEIMKIHEN